MGDCGSEGEDAGETAGGWWELSSLTGVEWPEEGGEVTGEVSVRR